LSFRLIDEKHGFNEDRDLLNKLRYRYTYSLKCIQILSSLDMLNLLCVYFHYSKNVPKKPSFLKRDLDARAHSEAYRVLFRLPAAEKLDGSTAATLWTPYSKRHVWGRMFLSQNYLCFQSRVTNIVL
jgi:hypothetical protein